MRTITVQKIAALLLAGLGAFLLYHGAQGTYYGRFGPGSGFFPIWVGAFLTGMALILLIQSFVQAGDVSAFFPDREVLMRPLIVAAASVALVPALGLFGFRLSMFVFVLLMPMILARQKWWVALLIAVVASFGTAWVFESLLRVRVAHATIPFLNGLGL